MKHITILVTIVMLGFGSVFSQTRLEQLPEFQLSKDQLETQLRFLASDELMGRETGKPGNTIAARFIAAHLETLGFTSPEGADQYFQRVPLTVNRPPQEGSLQMGDRSLSLGEDFILLDGIDRTVDAAAVYAGYGWVDEATGYDDYEGLDVAGKVVITLSGLPDSDDPSQVFEAMATKRKLAAARGAAALVEVYTLSYPWRFFRNYFGRERMELSEWEASKGLIHAWVQLADRTPVELLKNGERLMVKVSSGNAVHRSMDSQNVVGILEGTDPVLKDEYILLTAHFDHVGTQAGSGDPAQDTIFNGARDNGIGVVALLSAAEALAKQRPKRSVIILAVTAEEIGLLGSQYYAEHPLIPLEKTIFNLNTDGAGYTVTDAAAIIGWDRTGTNQVVKNGLEAFGLELIADPVEGLFDRSDNVSFAREGVPCLTFSPGFREFDQELMQYYHQVADEVDGIDFDYVHRLAQAFAHTARLIANSDQRPRWKKGDKYEAAGKALYGDRQ